MVYRVFVEKKKGVSPACAALLNDCRQFLGIRGLREVRILNRYDVENITPELFDRARTTVFSEPPVDEVSDTADLVGALAERTKSALIVTVDALCARTGARPGARSRASARANTCANPGTCPR